MAANATLTGLSRGHGVKVGAGCTLSVEEVALAVGQEIGHSSIKSAARKNRAVVLFLEQVEQANMLVETGITGGQFVQVTPLTQPAARITLSNVPPFVSDDCGEEGHLARACPSRAVPDVATPAAESAAPDSAARSGGEASVVRCGGPRAVPDGPQMESKAEGKRSECVRVTEVSGENVEVVVEVTGDSGEAGKGTGERGVPAMVAGELGEGGMKTDEVGVSTGNHWIKHKAASDLTEPEIFRLKKHMGKARKQLRELSNKSTSL
ncbi:hypothetical protein D4764_15G0008240 [Takifugu flavidus]|uniref:Uncharacterized protein n=1 Tax=Takifugu flavidus TaxID=433684 RepID=A0A5C6P5E1_9TELE|nr:hypothetical protein D4764_15G0008240 [Takifugu flavidus]